MQKAFLSDEQWARVEPPLPKGRSRGRPWAEIRRGDGLTLGQRITSK
jgi:hypothetical protein